MTRTFASLIVTLALVAAACGSDDTASSTEAVNDTANDAASDTTSATSATSATATATATTTPTPTSAAPTSVEPPAERLERLRIFHPETLAFAAPFTMLDTAGGLGDVADEVSIETWTTPDVLRSILVNGDSDVTAVPSYVGANLYNREVDVRLAAVVVWGLLWVLGPDGTPADWESLRGETVMVPLPNDMPDLVFRYLAEANGLTPDVDFTIDYYAQAPEVVGRLVSGAGDFAVLPEHAATVALAQANQNGQGLGRVFDLQAEWADATGSSPRIPQAGIVVADDVADDPDVLGAVLDALDAAVDLANAAAPETVATLSTASGVPEPIVADVIPRLNLDVVAAADARSELEAFFAELASLSADIIGGELPDSDFYLADPR
jgi:NitT/TauT family transport system substrate-binding protein